MEENIILYLDDNEFALQLKSAATGDPGLAHNFFRQFRYNLLRSNNDHYGAIQEALRILEKCKSANPEAYMIIHKGAPYYWIALSSFIINDFETAAYFFDAAASEDMSNDPGKRTPALLFMVLDSSDQRQAAWELTKMAENQLKIMVDKYNKIPQSCQLTIDQVKHNFLERAITDKQDWRTLVTAWISFMLEAGYRFRTLNLRTREGTWKPFYMHLFKGCVLFESLLKANPNINVPETELGSILACNKEVRNQLGVKGSITTGGFTFPDLISDIPDEITGVQSDIEFVARLRNTVGHNLGWKVTIQSEQYLRIVFKVSNACLHTISTIY